MNLLNITQEVLALEQELQHKPFLTNKEEIIHTLGDLLIKAVEKRCKGRIGIAFSGGIDSTLLAFICFTLKKDFILYNTGIKGSSDVEWATKIANFYNWNMKQQIYSIEEAEVILKKVVKIIPDPTVTKTGIAAPEYAVLEMAKKDQIDTLFGGLGAEEIYAGYGRHKQALKDNRVHEECWDGLKKVYENDLLRDLAVINYFEINMQCPFLDKEVVKYSMQIHPQFKITEEHKKLILLETAVYLGLEKEFAYRPKKAAQYGSGFHFAIEKLAKKKGFKLKKEYLDSLQ
ncbi:MAG: asparagine synthase-related protein [Candidatus Nanoarchaeia archaeon]